MTDRTRFLLSATAFYCFCQIFLLPQFVHSVVVESRLASEILDLNLLPNVQRPILICDAIAQSQRRQWWKHIQTRSKSEMVMVDVQTTSVEDNGGGEEEEEEGEQPLQDALEKVQSSIEQENGEAIYVASIGSSCSTDQLPIYEYCQSFFSDPDILSNFSPYTPMHEQLVISCNQAISTLSSRYYATTILSIGGGPIEYEMEAISQKTIDSYKGTRAITRTWDGDTFNVGWNSGQDILMDDWSDNQRDVVSACIQPGDILIIPKNWWFQSKSQQNIANISVLGRRCGSKEFEELVQHILPSNLANVMLLALEENEDEEKCQMLFDSIKLQNRG
ncbi:unnamed protein product [Cylindrotheca closterium]|uniref:Uncharacterized protein n=1 Tax=Cylindrotheca closterium TaxID=2856 RepID=A0AAD2FEX9_9STRA|nr:unnamed protein product [Cylindrotheca closterium]